MTIDSDTAWGAVERRDRSFDGRFVTGVLTTGIYCRPSCAARHPARRNVRFFADGEAARAHGLRPCKRCLPDDVARDDAAVRKALDLLASEEPPALAELSAAVGYSPSHFQRVFKRAIGLSPKQYARAQRGAGIAASLNRNDRVTDAIYDAGYSAPSRFYAETKGRLGMTPSAWKKGGAGVTIGWAVAETSLGPMLVAATDKGICRLSFDEDARALEQRFPAATIEPAGPALDNLIKGAVAAVENPGAMPDLPLDIAGTAFQEAVWRELTRIPPGETRSYAEIAAAVGKPGAVRATGSANGANNVAVLIPCHRVIRSDGSLGGYAYGLDRKQKLLDAEQKGRS
ncbi:MAG: bifunctional DNA-binding transcriptional regulator/O6-methylguanine-DNA methyltransferase Ada [Blastomonas sp.]